MYSIEEWLKYREKNKDKIKKYNQNSYRYIETTEYIIDDKDTNITEKKE